MSNPKKEKKILSDDLQDMLQEAKTTAEEKETDNNPVQDEVTVLNEKIKELESKLLDAEQITKKAQSDYIHMKFDFDSYMRRNEEQSKTAKVDTLIEVVKKFTPFIDSLRQSLENIPEDEQKNVLVQGVQMVYNKFISSLDGMGVKKIQSLGLIPNIDLHEAVSAQPVEDENMKGKIIQEFEQGFIYEKNDIRKTINTAKVVIGQ